MTIQREYYTFTELINKGTFDRNDLIHEIQTGKLPLYVLPSLDCEGQWITVDTCDPDSLDQYNEPGIENFDLSPCRISPRQFHSILKGEAINRFFKKVDIENGVDENDVQFAINQGIPIRYFSFNTSVTFNENDLVIMAADLEPPAKTPATAPVSTDEKDLIIWGWKNMEASFEGLTRTKIQYGVEKLDIRFQEKSDDPEGKNRTGLWKSELKRIFLRKRANTKK